METRGGHSQWSTQFIDQTDERCVHLQAPLLHHHLGLAHVQVGTPVDKTASDLLDSVKHTCWQTDCRLIGICQTHQLTHKPTASLLDSVTHIGSHTNPLKACWTLSSTPVHTQTHCMLTGLCQTHRFTHKLTAGLLDSVKHTSSHTNPLQASWILSNTPVHTQTNCRLLGLFQTLQNTPVHTQTHCKLTGLCQIPLSTHNLPAHLFDCQVHTNHPQGYWTWSNSHFTAYHTLLFPVEKSKAKLHKTVNMQPPLTKSWVYSWFMTHQSILHLVNTGRDQNLILTAAPDQHHLKLLSLESDGRCVFGHRGD